MKQHLVKRSRFLSLVLRHDPSAAQVELDSEGWVDIDQLLEGSKQARKSMTREELDEIVATNNKRRFAVSECGTKIRASQGHSLDVDLAMEELDPPYELFHGTASRFIESIQQQGLKKMNRQHVHLSNEKSIAIQVGSRHGRVVVLTVKTKLMYDDGFQFYRSANGVWLTDSVPPKYISFSS